MAKNRQRLKQRSDGRYCCKYKGMCFYGETEREALDQRDQYIRNEPDMLAARYTVRVYSAHWLNLYKRKVSKKCYNDYAKQLDALNAVVGSKQLSEVTLDDVAQVYTRYDGYSESTIKRARMLYIAMFDTAIENDLARKNPFRNRLVELPDGTVGSHRPLTPYEDQILLSTPADFRLPVLVMRYAGLRRGEMMALDIDRDVDFERGTIHVHEAVRYESNQPIMTAPKTDAGDRYVPLMDVLRKELQGHHGLLAPSAHGTIMSESAFKSAWQRYINQVETGLNGCQRRWYGRTREQRQLLAAGKLPHWKTFDVRPHDLRHSYCTMLRDAGVDLKLAIQWMGHADEKMILEIYDHITEYRTSEGLKKLEKRFKSQTKSGSKNGSQKGSQKKKEVS